jgi:hypothetical protein
VPLDLNGFLSRRTSKLFEINKTIKNYAEIFLNQEREASLKLTGWKRIFPVYCVVGS